VEVDVDIEIVCLSGLESRHCGWRLEAGLDDVPAVVDVLDRIWERDPGKPVVLVSTGLSGFWRLHRELAELGRNPFLVEATGIPETMLAGLSLDELIEYHAGFLVATLGDRRRAVKRRPPVTRRQLLRSLFIVPPEYVIPPRLRGRCPGEACPLGALDGERLDEQRCKGCLACLHRCPGVEVPAWTGVTGLAYAYEWVETRGLDGVLFICRRLLGRLDGEAVEASPARLLPFHVPCVGWLVPWLLQEIAGLGVYLHVYAGGEACSSCQLWGLVSSHVSELPATVSTELAEASMHAYTGYTRPRVGLDAVLERLSRAASRAAGGAAPRA